MTSSPDTRPVTGSAHDQLDVHPPGPMPGHRAVLLVGVLVAREDALAAEHREPAEAADDPRRLGRYHAIHGRREHRQLELVGPELPRDVDVVGVAGAPRGHDRYVVESIRATGLLATSDLDLHRHILAVAADEKTPRSAGPKGVQPRAAEALSGGAAK